MRGPRSANNIDSHGSLRYLALPPKLLIMSQEFYMKTGHIIAMLMLATTMLSFSAQAENQQLDCKVDFQQWSEAGLSTFYTEITQRVPILDGTAKLLYQGAFTTVEAELTPDGISFSCALSAGIKQTNGSQFGETADGVHYVRFNVEDPNGVFKTNKLESIKVSCRVR